MVVQKRKFNEINLKQVMFNAKEILRTSLENMSEF